MTTESENPGVSFTEQLDRIIQLLETLVAQGDKPQGLATKGSNPAMHPKRAEAEARYAPPLTDTEMANILSRFWAGDSVHKNAQCYANLLQGENFEAQLKEAKRQLYWLSRGGRIVYNKQFNCYRRQGTEHFCPIILESLEN